jgi:hypothetical protein
MGKGACWKGGGKKGTNEWGGGDLYFDIPDPTNTTEYNLPKTS